MVDGGARNRRAFLGGVIVAALTTACAPADGTRRSQALSQADPCLSLGNWIQPGGGLLDARSLLSDMATRPVVLLGESHTNPEDHRWQHESLVALHTLNPNMVVGFEMFPRSKQEVLSRWVAGELDEAAFLDAVEWNRVWGYDPELYLPLLRFVRMNRVPAVALNVDRSLVSRVGRDGWASIPEDEREGLSDPAPASEAYRAALARVYQHKHSGEREPAEGAEDQLGFDRFVAAQTTWDRAMAEALFDARSRHGADLAVGVMGRGHVESGYGVAHQLADQGIDNPGLLLTTTIGENCAGSDAGVADALFTVAAWQPRAQRRPTLGVYLSNADNAVRVVEVTQGSVAESTGVEAGDLIINAAGRDIAERRELIATIRRQAPGTWLPMTIARDGQVMELVAKFPPDDGKP